MPDPDLFGRPWRRQPELRQVHDDTLIEVEDTALDLLEYEGCRQDFRRGAKQESRVVPHRRPRDHIGHAMGHNGLGSIVVDTGKIARDITRRAEGDGSLAQPGRYIGKHGFRHSLLLAVWLR